MSYRVLTPHVGFRDDSGASHIYTRGATLPDDVPAAQVQFWLKTGQVEKVETSQGAQGVVSDVYRP